MSSFPRPADPPVDRSWSVLSISAARRAGGVALLCVLLWLGVFWAMAGSAS